MIKFELEAGSGFVFGENLEEQSQKNTYQECKKVWNRQENQE